MGLGQKVWNFCMNCINVLVPCSARVSASYYYFYVIYLNNLLLLLLRHLFKQPITITSQTITITITFPLLHLLSLLNQRNTPHADYKVIFKDLYHFHCITHYHRHIITDNIIIELS